MARTKKGLYHEWIEPEGLDRIRQFKRNGLTNEQIAEDIIGIHPSTLYDWMKKYPEIGEAIKESRHRAIATVENALYKSATGYTYEHKRERVRTVRDAKGGIIEVQSEVTKETRHVAPNPTSLAIYLNNHAPDRYKRNGHDKDSDAGGGTNVFFIGESEIAD